MNIDFSIRNRYFTIWTWNFRRALNLLPEPPKRRSVRPVFFNFYFSSFRPVSLGLSYVDESRETCDPPQLLEPFARRKIGRHHPREKLSPANVAESARRSVLFGAREDVKTTWKRFLRAGTPPQRSLGRGSNGDGNNGRRTHGITRVHYGSMRRTGEGKNTVFRTWWINFFAVKQRRRSSASPRSAESF